MSLDRWGLRETKELLRRFWEVSFRLSKGRIGCHYVSFLIRGFEANNCQDTIYFAQNETGILIWEMRPWDPLHPWQEKPLKILSYDTYFRSNRRQFSQTCRRDYSAIKIQLLGKKKFAVICTNSLFRQSQHTVSGKKLTLTFFREVLLLKSYRQQPWECFPSQRAGGFLGEQHF